VYGPSEEEVEQAQKEREQQERSAAERKASEERAAAEKHSAEEAVAKRKYEEEAPAREAAAKAAKEAAAEAEINAEDNRLQAEYEADKARDLKTPINYLRVYVSGSQGDSSANPGRDEVHVRASTASHVTVELMRYGHRTSTLEMLPYATDAYDMSEGLSCGQVSTWTSGCDSSQPEYFPATWAGGVEVGWTCKSPGGTYHYVVTAKRGGRTLTKRGTFKPVSAARCHTLERHEQEARERNARRYEEEVRARDEAEAREEAEWRHNCVAEGGKVVTLDIEGARENYCRSPEGGVMSVPR